MTREEAIQKQIQSVGTDTFPDDDVAWKVISVHDEFELTAIEARPEPATVGYEKFVFVLTDAGESDFAVLACFAWEGGWTLLFSDPSAGDGWRHAFEFLA